MPEFIVTMIMRVNAKDEAEAREIVMDEWFECWVEEVDRA